MPREELCKTCRNRAEERKKGIFGMIWDPDTLGRFIPLVQGRERDVAAAPRSHKGCPGIGNSLFPTTKWAGRGAADEVVWLQKLKAKLCHMAQD